MSHHLIVRVRIVHRTVHGCLDGCQISWRSAHLQLLVLSRGRLQLHFILINRHVHQLKLLPLLVLEASVVGTTWHTPLQQLDLFVKLVLLFLHLVDTRDQLDVVLHETRIVLTVLLQVARQLLTVVANVRLVRVTLACLRIVSLHILLPVGLLKYPCLVKPNDTLLISSLDQ